MGETFKNWEPCLRHDWEPIVGMRGLFRCRNSKCLALGYQLETIDPDFHSIHKSDIFAYKCRNSDCDNPTLEKGKLCPDCRRNRRKTTSPKIGSLTTKQKEALRMLSQSSEPISGEQSLSSVFESLRQKGLALKKTITVWSLSCKGEQFISQEDNLE